MRISRNIVPFIDVLLLYLMVFVIITYLLKTKQDSDASGYQQQNAIYLVALNWEGNADLDLWAKDPQGRIVSFHRREGGEGSLFSLNRDCLGAATTETDEYGNVVNKVNEEIISIRGTLVGEYIVNVHGYNLKGSAPVNATVKLIKSKPYKELITRTKEFTTTAQEETFFRFVLDKEGNVTEFNELPSSLTTSEVPEQQTPSIPFR